MRKILPILSLLSLLLPMGAMAVVIEIQNPLTATSSEAIVANLIDFIFKIATVLAPLMIIIGAALFITSAGNLQQIDRAKKIIIYTAIGFAIVLLAKGILAMIKQLLGVTS